MNVIELLRIRGLCGALASALCLGLAQLAGASSQSEWVRQLGTPNDDYAADVATDVYVSGWTHTFCGDVGCEGYAWLAKYSAAGVPFWKQKLEISGWEHARGVATDRNGNAYIVGEGLCDGWMAKYSATGVLLWKGQLGSRDDIRASGVATDDKGDVYISGYTQTPCVCTGPDFCNFQYHAWLFKYSAARVLLWKRPLGTLGNDYAAGVATDDKANVYIAGGLIAKYSAAGVLLWKRQLRTRVSAAGAATDDRGNIYIAGGIGGPNQGSGDAWIAKYSAAGVLLWERQLGTPGDDYAQGVATDDRGDVYMAGDTSGSLGGPNQVFDVWMAKYSAAGVLLWKRQLGTPEWDGASGVATDHEGGVYMAGSTDGSLGGPNQGSTDAWIAKYSQRR